VCVVVPPPSVPLASRSLATALYEGALARGLPSPPALTSKQPLGSPRGFIMRAADN
jgi:hypothetical protein